MIQIIWAAGSRIRLAVSALVLLVATGCASLLGIEPPEVRLINLQPGAITPLEQQFTLVLRVTNTNDFDIPLDGLVVRTRLAGENLSTGVTPDRILLPRLGSTVVRVPASTNVVDLLKVGAAVVEGQRLDYAIEGHTFYVGEGGRTRIPFSETGEVELSGLGG